MNERLNKIKDDSKAFWQSRSKTQKGVMIGSIIGVIALAAIITFYATRTNFVPLYQDLSTAEIGAIKEALDAQAVQYEIGPGGTSILVPEELSDQLLVQLASEGYPKTGTISYSSIGNTGFGVTDNEFQVLNLAATQNELKNLLTVFEGVKDANVMLTLPKSEVFVKPGMQDKEAQAAITLNTAPGQEFTDEQIATMYRIVEKSVPNLKPENIRITNQYLEDFSMTPKSSGGDLVTQQIETKRMIEANLQRQVQTMLSTLMGPEKVAVIVTSDIDFDQVNETGDYVEPVDEENMAGIEISAQRIAESYTGTGVAPTGTPEGGRPEDNLVGYQEGAFGDGEYERNEDTVNYDVNRIRKEVQKSPYRIRDLGIQAIIEPPKADDATSLDPAVQAEIENILQTVVRTSLDKEAIGEFTDEDIENKVSLSVQEMLGKADMTANEKPTIPWWAWVVGGILLAVIGLLIFFIIRSRKKAQEDEEAAILEEQEEMIIDDVNEEVETEATLRRKQLEKMAKEKPEDFAKLLRSWISED
ncbi:flagellar M-ring protein [Lysinibacillus alkalisoli]|uniref:Flagellar M-ring protein n=1 Tax=Lysinibacillus alkalisoli TaxID=1911548 RepID=A0A917G3U5_9BACI|nr:flagellar basal-body MS-ring/collar protein FliF [Lysinibacillus alkalisoli]GGG21743.1 flagellar M-ring protein [Lysinibacillus alkalisoli]